MHTKPEAKFHLDDRNAELAAKVSNYAAQITAEDLEKIFGTFRANKRGTKGSFLQQQQTHPYPHNYKCSRWQVIRARSASYHSFGGNSWAFLQHKRCGRALGVKLGCPASDPHLLVNVSVEDFQMVSHNHEMSEIETKIAAYLEKFENDLDAVEVNLNFLLKCENIDKINKDSPEDKKAVPYVLSAYALSSMLFAYLRSEGKDTSLIMPELARVQKKIQSLNDKQKVVNTSVEERQFQVSSKSKPARSHIRFESSDSQTPRSSKLASSGSKVEKTVSIRKKKTSRKNGIKAQSPNSFN